MSLASVPDAHAQLAVLGSPIAHSKSPLIHAAAYRVLDLPWSYDAIECAESQLADVLHHREVGWRGFSVTMPLKRRAYQLATELDAVARESGVVNTLVRRGGGWFGANTDVAGLAAAISGAGHQARNTVVLGSGATAVSALLAARRLGAEHIVLWGRNASATKDLANRFDGTADPAHAHPIRVRALPTPGDPPPTLVISTLPGSVSAAGVPASELTQVPLFDVAYDPWPSPLASQWESAGGTATPGTEMLVEQALVQIRLFVTGEADQPLPHEPEVLQAMRNAV